MPPVENHITSPKQKMKINFTFTVRLIQAFMIALVAIFFSMLIFIICKIPDSFQTAVYSAIIAVAFAFLILLLKVRRSTNYFESGYIFLNLDIPGNLRNGLKKRMLGAHIDHKKLKNFRKTEKNKSAPKGNRSNYMEKSLLALENAVQNSLNRGGCDMSISISWPRDLPKNLKATPYKIEHRRLEANAKALFYVIFFGLRDPDFLLKLRNKKLKPLESIKILLESFEVARSFYLQTYIFQIRSDELKHFLS